MVFKTDVKKRQFASFVRFHLSIYIAVVFFAHLHVVVTASSFMLLYTTFLTMFRLRSSKTKIVKVAKPTKKKRNTYFDQVSGYYAALRVGDLTKTKYYVLEEGIAVDVLFDDGSWPLHVACERGDYKLTELLLSLKANPNIKNRHGQTPLIIAVGYKDIVQLLISYNAKPNLHDTQKRTALHFAGAQGRADIVSLLLRNGAKVNYCDRWGRTPLHVTLLNVSRNQNASDSFHEVIRQFAVHDSRINKKDQHLYTPLFLGVNCGNITIVKTILDCGAKPELPSR